MTARMSGASVAAAVCRVNHETTKNTRIDDTRAIAVAVTPEGKTKTLKNASDSRRA